MTDATEPSAAKRGLPRLGDHFTRMSQSDTTPPWLVLAAMVLVVGSASVVGAVLVAETIDELTDGDSMDDADERIAAWVNDLRHPLLTHAFRAVTILGDPLLVATIVIATCIALIRRHHVALAVGFVLATAGTGLTTRLIKHLIERDRPPELAHLVDAGGYAFPSGHSAQAVACYGALAIIVAVTSGKRNVQTGAMIGAATIALAVGASRLYLGVHWPADVLVGWLVGIGWLTLLTMAGWSLRSINRPAGWWAPPRPQGPKPVDVRQD